MKPAWKVWRPANGGTYGRIHMCINFVYWEFPLAIQVLRITMLLELQDNRSLPGNYRMEHVEVWNQIQILQVGAQVNPLCDGLPHRSMVAISTIFCL